MLDPNSDIHRILTALYLPGGPRPFDPPRKTWQAVDHVVRREGLSEVGLQRAGLRQEAMLLADRDLMRWADAQMHSRRTLTTADPGYPKRWLASLGRSAPPALWATRAPPSQDYIGVVGTREIPRFVLWLAHGVGSEAARLGYAIVSGGAVGCDAAGVRGATEAGGSALELVPRGLVDDDDDAPACRVSLRPPGEGFSAAAAHERNTLIYAASMATVVAHSRFLTGGTWIGATEALRRKLCRVIIHAIKGDRAARALVALGGIPLEQACDLQRALSAAPLQRSLDQGRLNAPMADQATAVTTR